MTPKGRPGKIDSDRRFGNSDSKRMTRQGNAERMTEKNGSERATRKGLTSLVVADDDMRLGAGGLVRRRDLHTHPFTMSSYAVQILRRPVGAAPMSSCAPHRDRPSGRATRRLRPPTGRYGQLGRAKPRDSPGSHGCASHDRGYANRL